MLFSSDSVLVNIRGMQWDSLEKTFDKWFFFFFFLVDFKGGIKENIRTQIRVSKPIDYVRSSCHGRSKSSSD